MLGRDFQPLPTFKMSHQNVASKHLIKMSHQNILSKCLIKMPNHMYHQNRSLKCLLKFILKMSHKNVSSNVLTNFSSNILIWKLETCVRTLRCIRPQQSQSGPNTFFENTSVHWNTLLYKINFIDKTTQFFFQKSGNDKKKVRFSCTLIN